MCVEGSDGITQGHLGGTLMSSDSFFSRAAIGVGISSGWGGGSAVT